MKYLVFILTMVMVACQPSVNEKVYLIEGEAQGSTYHIKYIAERDENLKPVRKRAVYEDAETMSQKQKNFIQMESFL